MDKVYTKALSGLQVLFVLKIFSRVIDFVLNILVIRNVEQTVYGIASSLLCQTPATAPPEARAASKHRSPLSCPLAAAVSLASCYSTEFCTCAHCTTKGLTIHFGLLTNFISFYQKMCLKYSYQKRSKEAVNESIILQSAQNLVQRNHSRKLRAASRPPAGTWLGTTLACITLFAMARCSVCARQTRDLNLPCKSR